MNRYRKINLFAVIALVLLRVCVGWHFYKEGQAKVAAGGFSSYGFLSTANGPFAEQFRSMIPDYYGMTRTDAKVMSKSLADFAARAAAHFEFSEKQRGEVGQALGTHQKQLENVFTQWENEVFQYRRGYERIRRMDRESLRNVESMRGQKDTIRGEWSAESKPVLKAIDQITATLENNVNALATDEQYKANGYYSYALPNSSPMNSVVVDRIIPIFDMVVGILLIIGLLTPIASIAAAVFLFSVCLTQFPGAAGSQPVYYQAVEMCACLVLAGCDAGRYAGLDFLGWAWWQKHFARKKAIARA
jgi:uncharacterized membrane protein YphA (DoxX/SURF4 family)